MKTLAAILVKTGRPLELAEIQIPELKQGQVLVEIAYSGACGTQVMEVKGLKGEDRWVPHCLGHEGSGTVFDVSSSVTKVKKGDKVILSWLKGAGIEAGGTIYQWEGRQVNAGAVTTFQKYAVVSENRLTVLPKEVQMDVAVLLGCAAPTGMGAVYNVLKMQAGDCIAIFGLGGIGLNACLAAALGGASNIICIEPSPTRREMAKLFGATHVIDPENSDTIDEIKHIASHGVDLAVEATGLPQVMSLAMQSTRAQGGRAVVIGNAKHGSVLSLDPTQLNQGKSLMGTWGGDSMPDRDYPRYGRLLMSHRYPVKDMLSKPYSLESINQALDDLASGKVGRPLIDMSLSGMDS
jgi:S-(hydroxymethyl)glutathione dehydrogenase/alcohol dehydrogenase